MTAQALLKTESATSSFEVILDRSVLVRALGHCQGVVERKNTVPILANVMLEARNGQLKMTATDLEIAFVETIEAHVSQEGITTVSAHFLFDIVKKLKDGSEVLLKLKSETGQLEVKSGKSQFHLATISPEEFPHPNAGDLPYRFTLHAQELARLIDRTRFAMATEETRYYLNGIYLHATVDGYLRAVATDGHRLAQAEMDLPTGAQGLPGVIVSRKTISELRKLIDEAATQVEVSLSETQICFVLGSSILISRLIEGTFPDYERAIPQSNESPLEVSVALFAEAVDRVSIILNDKARIVKLHLSPNQLRLLTENQEGGRASEDIEVTYSGQDMDVGFNSRYILDMTQQMTGETLQLIFGDATLPVIARDPLDEHVLYVLMPMRV
ncbi:DNA polymerase III subunit beta [Candidatus Bealeia paramacronuclearis]|uniref:Beta sliding clamp n=1 Tax=Candidatus Bealeia paramacronuclearis TaxID=1921001 RepID=A0ABZ2C2F1_9PROT|nr:DNA polymerase III subunit beta [Candidatus Bealeia paramacronuclearis]